MGRSEGAAHSVASDEAEEEAREGEEGGREGRGLTDEAATLQQLAVAAMSSKPARLDKASGLLREALTLEGEGRRGLVGRAAMLQQLARVSEWRGDRQGAISTLHNAVSLALSSSTPLPSTHPSRVHSPSSPSLPVSLPAHRGTRQNCTPPSPLAPSRSSPPSSTSPIRVPLPHLPSPEHKHPPPLSSARAAPSGLRRGGATLEQGSGALSTRLPLTAGAGPP